MNSGQKVGELKWIVLKIMAKSYDNMLEAPTETNESCLERNGILLRKFKIDLKCCTGKVWLCPQDLDSLGNGSTDLSCSQHLFVSAPGLQTGWEFSNSLIHPLPKPMEDFQSALRGFQPAPASLAMLLLSSSGSVTWTPISCLTQTTFLPIFMPFFSHASPLCVSWWWQVMGPFLATHLSRRLYCCTEQQF